MDCKVRRIGLNLQKSSVIVCFEKQNGGDLRRRFIPVRGIYPQSNVKSIAVSLRNRHIVLQSVPLPKIEKMLSILRGCLNADGSTDSSKLDSSIKTANTMYNIDAKEDLNKLDDECLEVKKEIMEETFEANRKKAEDAGFEYDVRADFGSPIEAADWDDDSNQSF